MFDGRNHLLIRARGCASGLSRGLELGNHCGLTLGWRKWYQGPESTFTFAQSLEQMESALQTKCLLEAVFHVPSYRKGIRITLKHQKLKGILLIASK